MSEEIKATLSIEIDIEGRVIVTWDGLPTDKVVLFGLLEAAKDAIRSKMDKEAVLHGPLNLVN